MSRPVPAQQGDERELFHRYSARLRAIVAREVRTSAANVEDACSFAWLQMLRYQPARETLLSWLSRTAMREAVKLDRRQRRNAQLVEETDAGTPVALTGSSLDGQIEILHARETITAAGLRKREADLLALHVAGYSYAEIAAARRITERTVERQLMRAKRKLKQARRSQGG